MADRSRKVTITVKDPSHLEAHRSDFAVGLERAIQLAEEALAERSGGSGDDEAAFAVRCAEPVGYAGLARIRPWTRGDYWGPRVGRTIPSHLIVGKKRRTRWLCVWGVWRDEEHFVLHTLYPGKPAPREIHDPSLPHVDLPASLRFWTRHAIIVDRP